MNRSLQRGASDGDFFSYPRVVVGVDTEPPLQTDSAGLYLKDRLFLGYQEKSGTIEVISYNEAAGRFEFQVVRDYRPGGRREVVYANRALCTVCHQNQGPIFSRPLWDETQANPQIAARLEATGRTFHGVPTRQGVDIPNALDDATDRANLFSVYQALWQEGCEAVASPEQSIACRADLTRLLLQYRLVSSGVEVDVLHGAKTFSTTFMPRLEKKWPGGVLIPNPDIPNRNPFDSPKSSVFEPSVLRAPIAAWSTSAGSKVLSHLVQGLSGFLAEVDIERLDRHLFQQGVSAGGVSSRYEANCQFRLRLHKGEIERVLLQCHSDNRSDTRAGGFSMDGVVYLKSGNVDTGMIDRLSFGAGENLANLEVTQGDAHLERQTLSGRFGLRQKSLPLHARLSDGRAIQDVSFGIGLGRGGVATTGAVSLSGTATVTVLDDFSAVHRTIDAMAEENRAGKSDLFTRKPFRRAAVMKTLFEKLEMPNLTWCCLDATKMPAAVSERDSGEHNSRNHTEEMASPPIKAFHKYCATCHHERDPFPPNFLHGSQEQVAANLTHCAERILYRLEMGQKPSDNRPQTQMPPDVALKRLHLSPEEWADHPDLKVMKGYVADLLKSGDRRSQQGNLLSREYDSLRDCLPAARSRTRERGQEMAGQRRESR